MDEGHVIDDNVFHDEQPAFDEAELNALPPADALTVARSLPHGTRFTLGEQLTPVQRAFLDLHGYVVFARVARPDEVQRILEEADRVQGELIAAGRTKVNGLPIWVGAGLTGEPFIQRLPFTSLFSDYVKQFVRDARFEPVRQLIGDDARVGDDELDGVVLNRYIRTPGSLRPGLGWHTDGLREIFYLRMPGPMLNVGLHFDRIRPEDGGLRIIPGTHKQGFFKMALYKPYFVSHKPDKREIAVETWPGDLTVHDGRTWHRVQASPHEGAQSLRRSMYVPYVTGPYAPKSEDSGTPAYMRVFNRWMGAKKRVQRAVGRLKRSSAG